MSVSRGKQFEKQFSSCLKKIPNLSIDRFLDPSSGYAGIKNISDFVAYLYPFQYYFECKSTNSNTLNFSQITKFQWDGLSEKSKLVGVCAGVCIWFVEHDTTVFISIKELERLKLKNYKSINIKQIQDKSISFVPIEGRKKRVMFDYNVVKFMEDLALLGPFFNF